MKAAVLIFVGACLVLWALALGLMLAGDETAINAVIGIPIGAALWLGGLAVIARVTRQDWAP